MSAPANVEWVAADWGTSNLRLWVISPNGDILDQRSSDRGMGSLAPTEFEGALLDLVGDFLPSGRKTPVVICGMAGARQGWCEAPYEQVPCPPPGAGAATRVDCDDPRLDAFILPGLMQIEPADVMRGEETQIAGVLAGDPAFAGLLCLPGTHTKWARISGGHIESFRTFMTGELFALLSGQSVLRHSLSNAAPDEAAFLQAVTEAAGMPESLAASLFGIRAGSLVAGLTPAAAKGRLSGLLIGAELAAVRKDLSGGRVAILGSSGIAHTYAAALKKLGHDAQLIAAEETTLRGLRLAYDQLEKTEA